MGKIKSILLALLVAFSTTGLFAFVPTTVIAAPTQQQAQAAQLEVGVHQTYLTGKDWVKVLLVAYNQTGQRLSGRLEVEVNGKADSQTVQLEPTSNEEIEFKWQDASLPNEGEIAAKFRVCTDGMACPSWQERTMTDRRDGKVGNEIKIDTAQDGCKAGMKPGSDPKVWWMTTDGQEVAFKVVAPNEWFWADFSQYATKPGEAVVAVLIVKWFEMAPVSQKLVLEDCIGKSEPTPTMEASPTPETVITTTVVIPPTEMPTPSPEVTPVGQPTPVATPSASPTPTQPPVGQPPAGEPHTSITVEGSPTLGCEIGVCFDSLTVKYLKDSNDVGVAKNSKERKETFLAIPKGFWADGRDPERNWNELVQYYQKMGVAIKTCYTYEDMIKLANGNELEGFAIRAERWGKVFIEKYDWPMVVVNPVTCRVPDKGPTQSGCVLLPSGDYSVEPYGSDGQPVTGIRVEQYNCEEDEPIVECEWTKESVQAIRDRNPGHTVVWNEATGVVTFDGDTVETCGLPNTSGEFDPYEQPWRLPVPIGGSLKVEFMLEYGV